MVKRNFSLCERIRQVRRNQGLTQKDFADSLGIAQGYLSSIETGKKAPSDTLMIALIHLYGIDKGWLLTGEGEQSPATSSAKAAAPETSAGEALLLRRIAPDFPNGLTAEDILARISLPGSASGRYAMQAYGDFMAPTIQNDDLVLFKPGGVPGNGDIVLVNSRWGDILLRRFRSHPDGAWLSPDNSIYKPFQPGPDLRTIGIVTDVWRKLKI